MFAEMYEESDYYAAVGWHKEDTRMKQYYGEVLESLIKHMYGNEPIDAEWIDFNLQDLAGYFGVKMPLKPLELEGRE